MERALILSERDAAKAREALRKIESALTPTGSLTLSAQGLAPTLIDRHATMLRARKAMLDEALDVFERLRRGDKAPLNQWHGQPGVILVLARITQGLSQRELAQRLGMKEQQVQRYENDFYSGISLANLQKVATFLNVRLSAALARGMGEHLKDILEEAAAFPPAELERVLRFVKQQKWLPDRYREASKYDPSNALVQYLASTRDRFGSPALLRTGLNTADYRKDLSLLTWRARAADVAQMALGRISTAFDPTDISWIPELVKSSRAVDGPLRAREILAEHGILLVVVPQIPGLRLDGAAFLESDVPIIALTLRFDRVDSFWFTLLHELGHIYLHLHSGLGLGFFDDIEHDGIDEAESEANEFAGASIIADERWRVSPARVTKSEGAVEKLAENLEVHPALIYGRIRKERSDYTIFAKRVGQGDVRKWWMNLSEDLRDGWTNN
jgi:HTH-type transcriptional regulator / antitoxin HigA